MLRSLRQSAGGQIISRGQTSKQPDHSPSLGDDEDIFFSMLHASRKV